MTNLRMLAGTVMLLPVSAMLAAQPILSSPLLQWPGPFGGLPPFQKATASGLAPVYKDAVATYQAELDRIAANPAAPSFANTVAALDSAGRAFRRVQSLLKVFAGTAGSPSWDAVDKELAAAGQAVESRAAADPAIFRRVEQVYMGLPQSAPDSEASRLTELTHLAMRQAGGGLPKEARESLASIDKAIAERLTVFQQNLAHDEQQLLLVTDERRLAGIPEPAKAAAAAAAAASGHPGKWGIAAARGTVWAVETNGTDRTLREEVWRHWTRRGANDGAFDNRPVINDIIELRGRKARLLQYPTYADMILAQRMAGTPGRALELLEATWRTVIAAEASRTAELSALAAADGIAELRPWDRLYYLEKLARSRFGIDASALSNYFELGHVRDAMFAAARNTYGYEFVRMPGVATVSPEIEVYRAVRNGKTIGVVYLDLHARSGKRYGSWASEYRSVGDGPREMLPLIGLVSSPPPGLKGGPVLLAYDYANVLFHEFGHVLHMLSNQSRYRGTGSLAAPWDFIEVPSLLNERWLLSDRTLDKLPHYQTGKPMSAEFRAKLRQSRDYARVFSVNVEYLASALVDLKVHMQADGRRVDVSAAENAILADYVLPASIDPEMRAPHAWHMFTPQYGSSLYTYLWSDAAAADLAEVFLRAPGGLFDKRIGENYLGAILGRGHRVPMDQAFREFHGRTIDQAALMRRFRLKKVSPSPDKPR